MNRLKTTDNGGMPFELDDLRWIDESYRQAFYGIVSAFGILPNETYILSGCVRTIIGSNVIVTEGYISLQGEVLFLPAHTYPIPTGTDVDYFDIDISFDSNGNDTFEDGSIYDTYEVRMAKIEVGTIVLGTKTLVSNCDTIFDKIKVGIPNIAQNTLEILKNATFNQRGRIELATQSEINIGSDNTRAITPSGLKNANFIANVLRKSTVYVGNATLTTTNAGFLSITFPSVGTSNYIVLGSLRSGGNLFSGLARNRDVQWTVAGKSATNLSLIFRSHEIRNDRTLYFDYLLVKN